MGDNANLNANLNDIVNDNVDVLKTRDDDNVDRDEYCRKVKGIP